MRACRDGATELTFLTPLGALACFAAVLPLAALALARTRAARAATAVGLPARRLGLGRALLLAAACCAFGLAAAQPALRRDDRREARTDVQALFVLDVSRSMLASSGPKGATRLDRARRAARELRAAIPQVPAGLAGLTDRVLPYLFPTVDARVFASTLRDAVKIESPPPQQVARVATSFDALASLGTQGFFPSGLERRVCVVLTDGESSPFAGAGRGCRLVVVQLWDPAERIFRNGRAEPQYRPDDSAPALASRLGPVARENEPGRARELLRAAVGDGPVRALAGGGRSTVELAPYAALAGLALVLWLVLGPARLPASRGSRTMAGA
ncbi:MAG: von Willebrand factor type domain [Gaiellaceae bacterium]|nr:von Willebrand factor type domain [Gaiellaceae bacterium]